MKCNVCGVESAEGTAFCGNCGNSLNQGRPVSAPDFASLQTCPKCGKQAKMVSVFCPSCGFRLKAASPPPPIVGNPVYIPKNEPPQYSRPEYAAPQYATQQYAAPYPYTQPAAAPRKKHKIGRASCRERV